MAGLEPAARRRPVELIGEHLPAQRLRQPHRRPDEGLIAGLIRQPVHHPAPRPPRLILPQPLPQPRRRKRRIGHRHRRIGAIKRMHLLARDPQQHGHVPRRHRYIVEQPVPRRRRRQRRHERRRGFAEPRQSPRQPPLRRHQLSHRHIAHARRDIPRPGIDPKQPGVPRPLLAGLRQGPRWPPETAALQDRLMEQLPRPRIEHQPPDRRRPGRLPGQSHPAGIAAEPRDVVAHPSQRQRLIQRAQIARAHPRQMKIAQRPQPVVDADHHDIALARQSPAVIPVERPRPADPRPAMQPHQHRPRPSIRRRGPYRQGQAILALLPVELPHRRRQPRAPLRRDRTMRRRVPQPLPGRHSLRRREAPLPQLRHGIRHPAEHPHALLLGSGQIAERGLRDVSHWRFLRWGACSDGRMRFLYYKKIPPKPPCLRPGRRSHHRRHDQREPRRANPRNRLDHALTPAMPFSP